MRWFRRQRFALRAPLAAVALASVTLPADAHPFGDRYAAQRLDVGLYADQIEVIWRADAPRALLPQGPGGIDETRLQTELPAGLVTTLDGVTLDPTACDVRPLPELNTEHGFGVEVRVTYAADLRGEHALVVSNGNLSGTPSFHLIDATLPEGVTVQSSSLWAEPKGLRRIDLSDRWSRAESRRRFALTWSWPTGTWGGVWESLGPARRPLAQAHPRSPVEAWGTGSATPATFVLAAAGQLVLGALLGGTKVNRFTSLLLAAGALFAVGTNGLDIGASLMFLALAGGIEPRIALAVGAGAWTRPWSGWLLAAGALGVLLRWSAGPVSKPRLAAALALAVALASHGRAQPAKSPSSIQAGAPGAPPAEAAQP